MEAEAAEVASERGKYHVSMKWLEWHSIRMSRGDEAVEAEAAEQTYRDRLSFVSCRSKAEDDIGGKVYPRL